VPIHLLHDLEQVVLSRGVDFALDDRRELSFVGLDAGRQPQRSACAAADFEGALCRERIATERANEFREGREILSRFGPAPAIRRVGAEGERQCCDCVRLAMRVDPAGPAVGLDRMQDTSPRLQSWRRDAPHWQL
jgi:hypothetical protein